MTQCTAFHQGKRIIYYEGIDAEKTFGILTPTREMLDDWDANEDSERKDSRRQES